ncbi:hypothetical protein AVEN_198177-1 [Araneus ventricosus]|uniref:Uncharacterized protein n=1 Tax=Araneus ventricosus TaxID=182803 RepID=A0A4Y2N7Q1_ARAVE|nr:hypothetical protein AVEN_198177-1 [Araneus ventricosus]
MMRACGHRCAIGNNALKAAVDIDVYDASGNIAHIAGKSEFPMLRKNDNINNGTSMIAQHRYFPMHRKSAQSCSKQNLANNMRNLNIQDEQKFYTYE